MYLSNSQVAPHTVEFKETEFMTYQNNLLTETMSTDLCISMQNIVRTKMLSVANACDVHICAVCTL